MVMGTTLDTVNLGSVGLVQGRTSIAGSFSAFCSLAGGRQTRRPIDLGGVLYRETLTLVTGGVFAWTRNPMYVGLTLLLVGLAIALASDWTLVLLVPAALVLHFGVVKREESYLEAKFGEAYRVYKGNVPRYGWRSSKVRLR